MILIDNVKIEINSAYELELRQKLIEKAMFLLSCYKGTIPMNRDIGIDPEVISAPDYIARNKYTISAIECIEEFENRLMVDTIEFYSDGTNGDLIPKVVLKYNGE